MRTLVPRLLAGIALTLSPACSDDNSSPLPAAPEGYPYAYATNGCGPTDGPATRVFLAADSSDDMPPQVARLEFVIYRSAADLQGEEVSWSGSTNEAWAGRCPATGACDVASFAQVTFRENAADTLLSGTLVMRFQDGTSVSGGFDATWRRTLQLCG